uniref:LIM zinc-binding domain-containing protein n=1 Tax=Xiphophorus couchianus TaxID=32473 RepID=A0A3B5KT95_9TELE
PVPVRPVPQPHPKDEDTLVQMAEHIPAGMRTPMCAHCNMVIRLEFVLQHIMINSLPLCLFCIHSLFSDGCPEVINALKQTWHVYCFMCAACQQPIRNNTFHLEDGEPYCEQDFYSLFGTGCHGCEFPIEAGDKFLEALGYNWHDTCFVCVVCCASLEGQTFFSKKDKPLCKKHAHTVKI